MSTIFAHWSVYFINRQSEKFIYREYCSEYFYGKSTTLKRSHV